MAEIGRLGEVLRSAEALPWNHALYLPRGVKWAENTPCAVLDPDDAEEDEEPVIAQEHGLSYALDVATVQDIVANAREQRPSIDLVGLLEAFTYYHRNDAFLDLK